MSFSRAHRCAFPTVQKPPGRPVGQSVFYAAGDRFDNIVAIIISRNWFLSRNRAALVDERSRPHDAIDWSRNRDRSAQESRAPLAFRRAVTSGISAYVKANLARWLAGLASYISIVPFRTHTHTYTYTHIHTPHVPRFIFHRRALFHPTSIFSTNVLPGATLSVAITQTTCHGVVYTRAPCGCMRAFVQ